jgi:hypothetical protein
MAIDSRRLLHRLEEMAFEEQRAIRAEVDAAFFKPGWQSSPILISASAAAIAAGLRRATARIADEAWAVAENGDPVFTADAGQVAMHLRIRMVSYYRQRLMSDHGEWSPEVIVKACGELSETLRHICDKMVDRLARRSRPLPPALAALVSPATTTAGRLSPLHLSPQRPSRQNPFRRRPLLPIPAPPGGATAASATPVPAAVLAEAPVAAAPAIAAPLSEAAVVSMPLAAAPVLEAPVPAAALLEAPVAAAPAIAAPLSEAAATSMPLAAAPVLEAPVPAAALLEAPVAAAPAIAAPLSKAAVVSMPVAAAPVLEAPVPAAALPEAPVAAAPAIAAPLSEAAVVSMPLAAAPVLEVLVPAAPVPAASVRAAPAPVVLAAEAPGPLGASEVPGPAFSAGEGASPTPAGPIPVGPILVGPVEMPPKRPPPHQSIDLARLPTLLSEVRDSLGGRWIDRARRRALLREIAAIEAFLQRENPHRGILLQMVRRLPPALKMVRLDKAARSVESVI